MLNGLKIFNWLAPAVFLFIIGVNYYLTIVQNRPLDKIGCLVLLLLALAWLEKGMIFWITGILVCCYGLYNLIFISPKTAEPTAMEFTASLNYLIFGSKTGALMRQVIRLIPLFFYPSFLLFLLYKLRKG